MDTLVYSPYEELTVQLDNNTHKMHVILPWVSIEAKYDPNTQDDINEVVGFLNKDQKNLKKSDHIDKVSDFLSNFSDQIIAYSLPRSNIMLTPLDCSKTKNLIHKNNCPEEVLRILLPSDPGINLKNFQWQWNIMEMLPKSQIPNKNAYDPLSTYRIFLRLLMLNGAKQPCDSTQLLKLMGYFKEHDEAIFFEYVKYYLRQYHHITTTSYEALLPAVYSFPIAATELKRFAEEERGHGNFTEVSLHALGVENIYEIALNAYTPALINLLRHTASSNLTAFAMLTTCFELGGEQNEDPVATLLSESSKPNAAKGIQAHFNLNKSGVHFLNGEPYVKLMGGIDEYSVIEALRIAELFLMLQAQLDKSILEYGLRLWKNKYHQKLDFSVFGLC